eukprot:30977-Pelagococcus_subviridis.AAC.8
MRQRALRDEREVAIRSLLRAQRRRKQRRQPRRDGDGPGVAALRELYHRQEDALEPGLPATGGRSRVRGRGRRRRGRGRVEIHGDAGVNGGVGAFNRRRRLRRVRRERLPHRPRRARHELVQELVRQRSELRSADALVVRDVRPRVRRDQMCGDLRGFFARRPRVARERRRLAGREHLPQEPALERHARQRRGELCDGLRCELEPSRLPRDRGGSRVERRGDQIQRRLRRRGHVVAVLLLPPEFVPTSDDVSHRAQPLLGVVRGRLHRALV